MSLENEISELRRFIEMLESEKSLYTSNRISDHLVKKTITFSFLGVSCSRRVIEKQMPSKMITEIANQCKQWIEEIDRQANELIKSDN